MARSGGTDPLDGPLTTAERYYCYAIVALCLALMVISMVTKFPTSEFYNRPMVSHGWGLGNFK